ncbi:hypothetical protein ACL9RF_09865 [Sphingobacterium sp. Mn56C]|uniref:hypothetical protein n=1 Tax=Sphingobacterium sp. Mn56C TaxID=3395261 RepID=UPI003BCB6D28
MTEIIHILFNPLPNAIMTLLTGLSLLYWLFSMLMGDGFDFGDVNVDANFDGADIQDLDAGMDLETDQPMEPSFIGKTMDYINMGKAPLMVIVTLFKFIGWIITIISSLTFNLASYGWKSVFILIPVFLLTFFLMHYVTIPLVKLYKNVGYSGEERLDFLGRVAKMRSTIQDQNIGSVELKINSDVIRLPVKSVDGKPLKYGDDVRIVDELKTERIYLVKKDINLNNL